MEIVQAEGDAVVYASPERRVQFPGRRTIVSVCFRVRNFPFPDPGTYVVELYGAGEFLDDRTLHLLSEEGGEP